MVDDLLEVMMTCKIEEPSRGKQIFPLQKSFITVNPTIDGYAKVCGPWGIPLLCSFYLEPLHSLIVK